MKKRLSVLLLTCASTCATAGPETIVDCRDPDHPVANMPWLPDGAKTNACHQTLIGAGLNSSYDVVTNGVAAWRDSLLAAVRDQHASAAFQPQGYPAGDWLEHGSTGQAGELWWGRTARYHVIAGQESFKRLQREMRLLPVREQMAMSAWVTQRLMAQVSKKPMPRQPGDTKYMMFTKPSINYRQFGATTATFEGGYGGDGQVPPGEVQDARISLQTSPVVSGTLTFTLNVDGKRRAFSVPLMVTPETEYRIHAAAPTLVNGAPVECRKRPPPKQPMGDACEFGVAVPASQYDPPPERYDALGAFFGDRAGLVGVRFRLTLNIKERNRRETVVTGAIALRAEP